jgi:hypothetical protein
LALAADIRFASRERAVLARFELGPGAVPGGGPATRLPRLVGRGRALEILMSADDYDADLAERYGYVNRAIPDAQFVSFVDHFAQRIARFDVRAIREINSFVNTVSLPPTDELPPQMDAFFASVERPATQDRTRQLFALGLQQRGDAERHLGLTWSGSSPPSRERRKGRSSVRSSIAGGKIGNTQGCQAEPDVAAGRAGMAVFRGISSYPPALMLNWVVRGE